MPQEKPTRIITLKKDKKNRSLGRRLHTCRICGANSQFETYLVREMMQNTRQEFEYFVCDQCQCLQIAEIPKNMGNYYGSSYYSFKEPENINQKFETPVSHEEKILDVGCGSGAWLVEKAEQGWGNLFGCDPYIEKNIEYGNRVHIRKCSIHEIEGDGTFDKIRMVDSFEHMEEPLEVLKKVRCLLKPGGQLELGSPVFPNIIFEKYGPHWYQLDAPRHIFIHSKKSMQYLLEQSGFSKMKISYDSDENQIVRSFLYQYGISFQEQISEVLGEYFDSGFMERLGMESSSYNREERGAHMLVTARKAKEERTRQGKKVVYQIFRKQKGLPDFPYPPIYEESTVDYICMTDDASVMSNYWNVILLPDLEEETIAKEKETWESIYVEQKEIKQNEIIIGSLFEENDSIDPLVTIPDLHDLKLDGIHFDETKLVPTKDKNGNYVYKQNPVYTGGPYNGRELLLTIGVPVSNQIGTIERCLSHIKPLLDELPSELLVVNTGSTDGTLEVCRKYGARIVDFPWCNNMSEARNTGIYHAKGEWYMSIDDDEWFENVDEIIRFFKEGIYKKVSSASYIQRNYMSMSGEPYQDHYTTRMARITPEVHFEGRIHDGLYPAYGKRYQIRSFVHHYGFALDTGDKRQEKRKRNIELLLYDIFEYPDELRYNYQLANEDMKNEGRFSAFYWKVISMERESMCVDFRLNAIMGILSQYLCDDKMEIYQQIEKILRKFVDIPAAQEASLHFFQAQYYLRQNNMAQMKKQCCEYKKYHRIYINNPEKSSRISTTGFGIGAGEDYFKEILILECIADCALGNVNELKSKIMKLDINQLHGHLPLLIQKACHATDAVYEIVSKPFFEKLEKSIEKSAQKQMDVQKLEEWRKAWLTNLFYGMYDEQQCKQQKKRFCNLLQNFSIIEINSWFFALSAGKWELLSIFFEEDLLDLNDSCSLQEKYFYSLILEKQRYREMKQEKVIDMDSFVAYVTWTAWFAEEYYSTAMLWEDNYAVSKEIQACCHIYHALNDEAEEQQKKLEHLREAVTLCFDFKEEVKVLLNQLSQTTEQKEMEKLCQMFKVQVKGILEQGMLEQAKPVLLEAVKYFPEDVEIQEMLKVVNE